MNLATHENDFYTWTQEQAHLLKTGQLNQIDWQNIAEEIEDMERSEKRELESRLEVLIMHLLKWQFHHNLRSRSWQLTIKEQRLRLEKMPKENPSLSSILADTLEKIINLLTLAQNEKPDCHRFLKPVPTA